MLVTHIAIRSVLECTLSHPRSHHHYHQPCTEAPTTNAPQVTRGPADLLHKDAAVLVQQVGTLLTWATWLGSNHQSPLGILEHSIGVCADADLQMAGEEWRGPRRGWGAGE